MRQLVPIAIAVVEHAGQYLVGVRAADQVLPGKAEFPGGKIEPGETPAQAAVRECREETGLTILVRCSLLELRYCYEHATVQLHFLHCQLDPSSQSSPPALLGNFRWVQTSELSQLDFPAANAAVLRVLSELDVEP